MDNETIDIMKHFRFTKRLSDSLKRCCELEGYNESRFVRIAIINRLKEKGYWKD